MVTKREGVLLSDVSELLVETKISNKLLLQFAICFVALSWPRLITKQKRDIEKQVNDN